MMKTLMIVVVLFMGMTSTIKALVYPCLNNNEDATEFQKKETKKKIKEMEGKLEDAIKDYKKELDKKNEMMLKLQKSVSMSEALMRENYLLRKKILKYWEDVKKTNSRVQ